MNSNKNTASSSNEQKKKKKNKSSSPYVQFALAVVKTVVVIFVALGCVFGGVLGGTVLGYVKNADTITPDQLDLTTKLTSFIYDKDNNEIAQLKGSENRVVVEHSEIPDNMRNAFIAIEDQRFERHNGVDTKRFVKAALSYIVNLGDASFGGSTITQQLVKNITGNQDSTIKRKVQEAWQAMQLEKDLSKDQILDNYMNRITTGSGCYGVQAAAKKFFNKDVKDLSLAECASIAGVTKSPGRYDPTLGENSKKRNKERQEIILKAMLDQKKITQNEYDEAIAEKLKISEKSTEETVSKNVQSYFVDYAVTQVQKDLMKQNNISAEAANYIIYNRGIHIYTTQDTNIQKVMNEEFTDIKNFPVNAKISNPDMQAQAAMIVLDPITGQIRGMYGAYGEKKGSFTSNRATSMKRQPGSSFKPIAVYAPAIDLGIITPATVIDDVPVYMNNQTPDKIYPKNAESGDYRGLSTIRKAIRSSINVVAATVFRDYLKPEKSIEYLKKVNIDRSKEGYISMALGGLNEGVNPLIMAASYAPFVNDGVYTEPIAYTKVTDAKGNILLDKTKTQEKNIAYKETTAFLMASMMKDVVTSGTAAKDRLGTVKNQSGKVIPTAGKTGTTNDNYDKWFVGYSPYYVGATWYGYNTPKTLKSSEYYQALKIWNKVMNRIHAKLEVKDFKQPEGIVKKSVCMYSGKTPGPYCSQDPRGSSIITEYFAKGTEPSSGDICDVHIKAKVDTTSKDLYGRPLLANPYCPPSVVQEKVFIQRPVPYLPKDPSDLTLAKQIADWMYELPQGEYCTIHSTGTIGPTAPSTNPAPATSTSGTPTLPSSFEDLSPLQDTTEDVLP